MYVTVDYLNLRGDITFDQKPVNIIDQMIFTCMGKPDFTDVVPGDGAGIRFEDAYKKYLTMGPKQTVNGLLEAPELKNVLPLLAESARFKDIIVSDYVRKIVPEITEQFSAMTVEGPDDIIYVTFRGTDDTLIGWKENCELAFVDSVPAQKDALAYLTKISEKGNKKIIVTGHSKGGNLAVYAAVNAPVEIQERIINVYSFDGPGFPAEFFETDGYARIKEKITTIVSKHAIVGMMMQYAGKLWVVDCEKEGLAAHDTFIWSLNANSFISSEQSEKSKLFRSSFNEMLSEMTREDKINFTNEVFSALSSTGAEVLNDFTSQSIKQYLQLAKNVHYSRQIHKFIMSLSSLTIKEGLAQKIVETKSTASMLEETISQKIEDVIAQIEKK